MANLPHPGSSSSWLEAPTPPLLLVKLPQETWSFSSRVALQQAICVVPPSLLSHLLGFSVVAALVGTRKRNTIIPLIHQEGSTANQ